MAGLLEQNTNFGVTTIGVESGGGSLVAGGACGVRCPPSCWVLHAKAERATQMEVTGACRSHRLSSSAPRAIAAAQVSRYYASGGIIATNLDAFTSAAGVIFARADFDATFSGHHLADARPLRLVLRPRRRRPSGKCSALAGPGRLAFGSLATVAQPRERARKRAAEHCAGVCSIGRALLREREAGGGVSAFVFL